MSNSFLEEPVAIPSLCPPPPPLAPVVDVANTNVVASDAESKEHEIAAHDEFEDQERFKSMQLPVAWEQCPLSFDEPIEGHRLLVCKTPIDADIAEHFKIPKSKLFLPHMLYTLPSKGAPQSPNMSSAQKQKQKPQYGKKERKIGLVIDLTNQAFYDEISFNQGKKLNKVKRRVLVMEDLSKPTELEVSSFIGLVRSFFHGAQNQDRWIVVHDDLGYNLAGFMCAAYMVKELCYSVDAAVYQYSKTRRPGIFEPHFVRMLHELYSEPEDIEIFEKLLSLRPMAKPAWMMSSSSTEFAKPVSSLQQQPRKRTFSQMNAPAHVDDTTRPHTNASDSDTASVHSNESSGTYAHAHPSASSSLIQEPMQFASLLMDGEHLADANGHAPAENVSSSNNGHSVIVEPCIIVEPTVIGDDDSEFPDVIEPPLKRNKPNPVQAHVPAELKEQHSYLVAVRDQHLQHLTAIVLQLSKNKDIFHSILHKPATIPKSSLMNLRHNYRISWLGKGYRFWLMILGKSGSFFVDPQYFATGKLGGVYHIDGTVFLNEKTNQYLDGTLCCGELVVDHILKDKQSNEYHYVPRFLITDVLVIEKQSYSKFPHPQRLQHAENHLYRPYAKSLAKSRLRIRVKPMYGIDSPAIVDKLQKMIHNELPHECDGLGLFPIKPPFGQRLLRMQLCD